MKAKALQDALWAKKIRVRAQGALEHGVQLDGQVVAERTDGQRRIDAAPRPGRVGAARVDGQGAREQFMDHDGRIEEIGADAVPQLQAASGLGRRHTAR